MSDIRFNQWLHQSGTGGVSQDHIGNIGIGTTNPSIVVSAANTAVLNVGVITANNLFVNNAFNGDITGNVTGNISGATGTFSGNVDIADKIIHTGDTDTAMRFPADNTFAVDTAGSERLRITSSGRIGIGTDIPGVPLHVFGRTRIRVGTDQVFSVVSTNGITQLQGINDAANAFQPLDIAGSDIRLSPGSTEAVRITSAGNVGIGTDNPNGLLSLTAASGRILTLRNSTTGFASGDGSYLALNGSDLQISNAESANLILYTGDAERFRINSAGNIGMSNDMTGAGGVYARLTVQMPTQSGGSGIQVANSSNGSGDGTTSNIVLRSVNNDCSQWADAEYRASQHIFAIQGTERMRINANGHVTKPNQPRFWARRSADETNYDGRNVGGSWIKYDVEEYDIGGNFATSGSDQGRFIAPVSGLYLFQAAAYKNTGTADWSQSWFDVDGSRKNGTDWVFSSSTRFAQNSIQIYLTAGQKIGFHPYNNASGNTILDTHNHTWFKGCLLG